MFRATNRQRSLFAAEWRLSEGARARLEKSWAEWFRREVFPELLEVEAQFAGLYGDQGRPNWSVARLLGVCFAQHMWDLPDQRALDALAFDVRWQHALDLTPEQAYLARRSLVEFRRRLVKADPEGTLVQAVFDRLCSVASKKLGVSTADQRLDSTQICSNIRGRGRLSLARETLRVFLRSLGKEQLGKVPEEIRSWYQTPDEGWEEQPSTKEETKTRLQALGDWIAELLALFAQERTVKDSEQYGLLTRLLEEHAEAFGRAQPDDEDANDGNANDEDANDDSDATPATRASARKRGSSRKRRRGKKRRKKSRKKQQKKASKARFWSPHDPDASFGHKGLGYHVHITETCNNESTELITDYDVVTAAEADVGKSKPVLERLRRSGRAPERLFADGGYPTPADLVEARNNGTELYAPVHRSRLAPETLSRADFQCNDRGEVVACPAGHAPARHGGRASSDASSRRRALHAFFDAKVCRACPLSQRCPVRAPNNTRSHECRLEMSEELIARDKRWAEQHTEPWQQQYRIRSGVEATMSELKRAHGIGRLRVRRRAPVKLQVAFKAIACNLKRWGRAARAVAALFACLYVHLAFLQRLSARRIRLGSTAG